jgi:ribosomal protein L23
MERITVIPRATEKAYGLTAQNTYVFNVPLTANKQQIAAAVESQFEVTVTGVKTYWCKAAKRFASLVERIATQALLIAKILRRHTSH